MRVLRVIARMNLGGPAHHVSLLSGRLPAERYRTLLVSGRVGHGEASAAGLAQRHGALLQPLESLGPDIRPLSDVRALAALILTVRRFQPAIVHTHTAKAGIVGRLAALLAARPRPLIVHTYHGHVLEGYFGRTKTAFYRMSERALARPSDCLIGVSRATVDDLVRMRIAPRSKFRTIALGLELERFLGSKPDDGSSFRREVGAGADDVLLTFVGRLVPIKRIDRMLRVVARARADGAPVRLAIVGDGALRGELETLARTLGLTEVVHFSGYRLDLEAIAAAGDVAILTSDNEGTPVSLIEAAAAATPAVATAVGGVPEVVTRDTGLLAAAQDEPALARAVGLLATDRRLRERMGTHAREHVRKRYSSERLLKDVDALYQQLLERRPRVRV